MTSLVFAAALLAGPALAAEEPPVATANGVAQSTAEQIDAYLRNSPAATLPSDEAPGVTPGDEARQVHGMVEVGVGTHGYRSIYMQSDMPIGKTGTLSVAVGETRGPALYGGYGGYGGYGYGGYGGAGTRQTLGIGLDFSGEARGDRRCGPGSWKDDGPRRLDPSSVDVERRQPCGAGRGPRAFDTLR